MAGAHDTAEVFLIGLQLLGPEQEEGFHPRPIQLVQDLGHTAASGTLEGEIHRQLCALRLLPGTGGGAWRGGGLHRRLGGIVIGIELLHIGVVSAAHGVLGILDELAAQPLLSVGDADQGAVIGGGIAVAQAEVGTHRRQRYKDPAIAGHRPHLQLLAGPVHAGTGVQVKGEGTAEAVQHEAVPTVPLDLSVGHPQVDPGGRPVKRDIGDVQGAADPGGHSLQRQGKHLVVLRHQVDLHRICLGGAHQPRPQHQYRRAQQGKQSLFPAHVRPLLSVCIF